MKPRALLAASALLALLSPPRALAETGDLELALTSEALAYASDTVSATTSDAVGYTPGLRVGYAPLDQLTLLLGWRKIVDMSRGDHGYDLTTSGDAIYLGARWALGLHPVFDVRFELELEALHTDYALDLGGLSGATSAWGFGAIPKVAAALRVALDPLVFDVSLFGGLALRTDHHADAIHLSSLAPSRQVAPLDLGRVNLSGLVFGLGLALVF